MSIIQVELYDAFLAAGAPEDKARAAAEVIAQKPQSDEMATKTDIVRLEGKMDSKMAELRAEIAELKNKLILWIAACTTIIIAAIGIATTVIIAFIN